MVVFLALSLAKSLYFKRQLEHLEDCRVKRGGRGRAYTSSFAGVPRVSVRLSAQAGLRVRLPDPEPLWGCSLGLIGFSYKAQ